MAKKKTTSKTKDPQGTRAAASAAEYDLFGDPIVSAEEIPEEDFSVKDKTGPFEIIRMMFEDWGRFVSLSNHTLARNAFMITRTMAIKYPRQMAHLNAIGINQAEAVRYIGMFCRNMEKGCRPPQWVYTKGQQRAREEKEQRSGSKATKAQKEQYAIYMRLSMKDLETALKRNPDGIEADIFRVDKLLNPPADIVEKEKIKP